MHWSNRTLKSTFLVVLFFLLFWNTLSFLLLLTFLPIYAKLLSLETAIFCVTTTSQNYFKFSTLLLYDSNHDTIFAGIMTNILCWSCYFPGVLSRIIWFLLAMKWKTPPQWSWCIWDKNKILTLSNYSS